MEENEKDNPFSFKHFLKTQGPVNDVNINDVATNHSTTEVECDDNEMPFPDVRKDSPSLKKKTKGKKSKVAIIDDELSDANPFSFKKFVKKDAALRTTGRVLQIVDDEVEEVCNGTAHEPHVDQPEVHPNLDIDNVDDIPASQGDFKPDINNVTDEITKLRDENTTLKNELEKVSKMKEKECKRAETLYKKLKEFQQKENEETAALEKMVHMVEKNLELTTQRAVKAEAMAAKLREENKSLKSNFVSKTAHDELVEQHHSLLSNIKQQAMSASHQLNETAMKAEQSLKSLYSGVESFKLVSELLKSIDKFSDSSSNEPRS